MCGGQIHPIAGRCKHCKGDLGVLRAGRPAAATALPQLDANGRADGYKPNGQPIAASPVVTSHVDPEVQILPPRPTGRMYVAQAPTASWWRHWPVIAIGVAGLGIVVAVIVLFWPRATAKDSGTREGSLSIPAPDRMETNPLLPPTSTQPRSGDPWNDHSIKPKDPDPSPAPNGAVKPDLDIPDDPDDPGDPLPAAPGGFGGPLSGSGAIVMAMMKHACTRAESCVDHLDPVIIQYCEMANKLPTTPPPASCPAAQRCLNRIDEMSCSTKLDDVQALASVMYNFQDCVKAIGC